MNLDRNEIARLASVADAVASRKGNVIPLNWQPPKHANLLRAPSNFIDGIIDRINGKASSGASLPWKKADISLRLRPSEMTVWAGSSGSAKSTVLSEIMLSLAVAGHNVVVISLEMPVPSVAAKMAIQSLCNRNPSRDLIVDWAESLDDRLCFLDLTGDITPTECVRLARYCAHELGTQHILIDNMTKIVSADNEHMDQQRQFVAQLHRTALDTGMHVHLVAHTRKPEYEEKHPPGRYEVAGSRTLVDQPDNVVMIWRNRLKERAQEEGELGLTEKPDLILNVDKQRHDDFTGFIGLYFDKEFYRTVETWGTRAEPFMNLKKKLRIQKPEKEIDW
jgi:twinkle protein